ncbi:MAG: hypothetical protein QM796_05495 [Chthoniobacteraceae bacterium]
MKVAAQITFYLTTFVSLFLIGILFDFAFFQAGLRWDHLKGHLPMPPLGSFFARNHQLPVYLALLPWLTFVGAPLLARTSDYWEFRSFVLRSMAFVASELLLLFFLGLALASLLTPDFPGLDSTYFSLPELIMKIAFWLLVGLIGFLAIHRLNQLQK